MERIRHHPGNHWLATIALCFVLLASTAFANDVYDAGIAELMAAIGEERILGLDHISPIIPSTSECIGDTSTPLCLVDTFVACLNWIDRPETCVAAGIRDDLGYASGPWEYSRFRYKVTRVDVLDETSKLPWSPPLDPAIEPAKQYHCNRDSTLSPEPGDIAIVYEERECQPGGPECVAQMTKPNDVQHDICIRIEPCYGYLSRAGLVVRPVATPEGIESWQLVEYWGLYDSVFYRGRGEYMLCE